MVKLLILADDFTGALDSGVKLAAHGSRTKVITAPTRIWALQQKRQRFWLWILRPAI